MNVNLDWSILYVLICFFIVFFVAKSTLLKRLDEILAERHEMIEGARQQAHGNDEVIEEKINQMNAALAEAREKAYNERSQSREQAMEKQGEIVDKARAESSEMLAARQEELEASVDEARQQLKDDSNAIARDIANRLLGRTA